MGFLRVFICAFFGLISNICASETMPTLTPLKLTPSPMTLSGSTPSTQVQTLILDSASLIGTGASPFLSATASPPLTSATGLASAQSPSMETVRLPGQTNVLSVKPETENEGKRTGKIQKQPTVFPFAQSQPPQDVDPEQRASDGLTGIHLCINSLRQQIPPKGHISQEEAQQLADGIKGLHDYIIDMHHLHLQPAPSALNSPQASSKQQGVDYLQSVSRTGRLRNHPDPSQAKRNPPHSQHSSQIPIDASQPSGSREAEIPSLDAPRTMFTGKKSPHGCHRFGSCGRDTGNSLFSRYK